MIPGNDYLGGDPHGEYDQGCLIQNTGIVQPRSSSTTAWLREYTHTGEADWVRPGEEDLTGIMGPGLSCPHTRNCSTSDLSSYPMAARGPGGPGSLYDAS